MVVILDFVTKKKMSYFLALNDPLDQSQANQNWRNNQLGLYFIFLYNNFIITILDYLLDNPSKTKLAGHDQLGL